MQPETVVIVRFSHDPCCGWHGTLLTPEERFIEFEIGVDRQTDATVVERWADVTNDQNVSAHNRGIGASAGYLALQILRGECIDTRGRLPRV